MLSPTKKIFFSLITVSAIIVFTEGTLRLAGFKFKPAPFIAFSDAYAGNPERALAETGENYAGGKDAIYFADSVVFWKFKPKSEPNFDPDQKIWKFPNSYRINSKGFRGDEFAAKKNGDTIRIIAIGDSTTFGLLVPENKTYYKLLEKRLNEELAPLKFEVISAGLPGYTSYQGRRLLKEELLSYAPDAIIAYFGGINEFNANYYTDRDYARYIQESLLKKWSQKSSALGLLAFVVQKIKPAVAIPPPSSLPEKRRVPPPDFTNDLIEIVDLTMESGAIPIMVVPPHSRKVIEMEPEADAYSSIVRSLSYPARIADVDSQFKQQAPGKMFAEDRFHPNEAGHWLIAETIYNVLADEIRKKQDLNISAAGSGNL